MEQFCYRCARDETRDIDGGCDIIMASMVYGLDDPEYPPEWVQDDDGARCTAFEGSHGQPPA
jgi:hypothetical protein